MSTAPRTWIRTISGVGAVALVLAGCGTRVEGPSQSAAATPATQPPAQAVVDPGSTPGVVQGSSDPVASTPSASSASPAGTAASGAKPSASSAASPSPARQQPGAASPSRSPQTTSAATRPGGNAGSKSGGAPAAPTPAAPGKPGPKSEIVVGTVGTLSGPLGANTVPMLQATQLWGKWVNSKGGINGHMVRIIPADDGGDPARHRALLQELVEQKRVLAFIANPEPLTGASGVEYLNAKRIPVIGMTGGESWARTSPMYFPQGATGQDHTDVLFASFAQQSLAQGKTRFGLVTCSEAQACRDFNDQAERQLTPRGIKVVYKAGISLAQPDFTAECLAAQNAKAEVFFVGGDGNTLRRVAASCKRQGYQPIFATGQAAITDDLKSDPNLEGAIAYSPTFHYVQSGTPATDDFKSALKQFGGTIRLGGLTTASWAAGRMLEKAAANLPEPPTTEAILRGLWSFKGEDFGGLTGPLTFTENQPPPRLVCWFNVHIRKGAWGSPDEFKRTCE